MVVSLPERHRLLAEAIASIHGQSRQPDDCVIGVDYSRLGEVANNNRLADATDCDWLAFLHDDDLWAPAHLATAELFEDTADVIVSDFCTPGRTWDIPKRWDDWPALEWTNWFPPSTVIVRRETFGRWEDPPRPAPYDWVDWSNWRRLYATGARFAHTAQMTVSYRFDHEFANGSWDAC